MTEEKKIFCRKINELIGDIQAKDERKSVLYLEQTVFEKKGFISNALTTTGNPSIDKLRNIIKGLEKYKSEMRDYSALTTDELKKKIKNLISNKNYNPNEIATLMGKTSSYVYVNLARDSKHSLLNIYDFVVVLPAKEKNGTQVAKTVEQKASVETSVGAIHVVGLIFEGNEYYLESAGGEQLVFVKSSDRAQWFDETPEANLEFLTGRKKVVIEFD